MADVGLKFAAAGDDVKTVTDKNVQFSSKFSTFKINQTDSGTISTNGSGDGSDTFAHGLSYPPSFEVFLKATAKNQETTGTTANMWFGTQGQDSAQIKASGSKNFLYIASTDDTNLKISLDDMDNSTDYDFKSFIFTDLGKAFTGTGEALTNDVGIKTAIAGVDVKNAQKYNLGFLSSENTFKISTTGSFSMDLPAHTSDGTWDVIEEDVAHGLGYAPVFMAWVQYKASSDNFVRCPRPLYSGATDALVASFEAVIDSTNLRLSSSRFAQAPPFEVNFGASTANFRYIIFTNQIDT